MNEFALETLHFLFNSALIFFLLALVVETFFLIFRIKNHRARSVFRLLPLLKLNLDLIIYFTPHHAHFNINPFGCHTAFKFHFFNLMPKTEFALTALDLFVYAFFAFTLFFLGRKIFHIIYSVIYLKKIIDASHPSLRPIVNENLKKDLIKKEAEILLSDRISVPFATASGSIVFPNQLASTLAQDEFEAIIAHELEHLRWRDPLVKLMANMASTLFWWIPMAGWLKRIDNEQEEACDKSVSRYGLPSFSLAHGIFKALSGTRAHKRPEFVSPLSQGHMQLDRVSRLLTSKSELPLPFSTLRIFGALALSLCIIFTFWIC